MNGVHDMGGMHGFGPIGAEPAEPVFHADWERSVYAVSSAIGPVADWTLDADRHSTESIPGPQYLNASYYEKWFISLCNLLVERGYVSAQELASGTSLGPAKKIGDILKAEDVAEFVSASGRSSRNTDTKPGFEIGQEVRTRNTNPTGHTRLPRYARGHKGIIERIHGVHVFPDTNAHGQGEQPQWLYAVCFTAKELWGSNQPGRTDIFIDLWEPYLEAA